MAAAGAPLRAIQEWLGHSDYRTTSIYADYAPDLTQGAVWAARAFPLSDAASIVAVINPRLSAREQEPKGEVRASSVASAEAQGMFGDREMERKRNWSDAHVDRDREHIVLYYGGENMPAAALAPRGGSSFNVEFLTADPGVRGAVERELDFYLVELERPNAWAYAIYHCGTAANAYSSVHWAHQTPDLTR